jgi:hypothetical protein
MKLRVLGLLVLLSALTALVARSGAQPGKESDEELAKKIQLLNEQIEKLRQQQNPLFQEQQNRDNERAQDAQRKEQERLRKEAERAQKAEAERQAKEAAEKKKHFAKMEIRGLLGKGPEAGNWHPGLAQTPAWYVTINELKWKLDFGANKELAANAVEFAGKPVVITGSVATVKVQLTPYVIPQVLPPQPWPPQPFPQPVPVPQPHWQEGPPPPPQRWQQPVQLPQIQVQVTPVEVPLTISVESLKGAKD